MNPFNYYKCESFSAKPVNAITQNYILFENKRGTASLCIAKQKKRLFLISARPRGHSTVLIVFLALQVIPVQVAGSERSFSIISLSFESPVVPLLDIPGDGFIVHQGSRNSNCSD